MLRKTMTKIRPLYEILGEDDKTEEVYSSDQKRRKARAYKGLYSRQKGLFNFLQLIKDWEDIVGDFMAKNTTPLKIKKNTLFISTKHSIFAQELGFLGPTIIQKVKERYPDVSQTLSQIKFIYSDFSAEQFKSNKPVSKNNLNKPKPHKFSPHFLAKKSHADKLFGDITDKELKVTLIEFYLNHSD